jgi:hypothetical protein
MRILTTNDFVGSMFPQPTSYGELPGAAALQATVDDLRTEAGGGVWVDTGDFAQGSALGALSDGVWPFLALRELSIDVAVVGNHELDWGDAHLRRWGRELPFGLLAANLDLGLPATRMLEPRVGVIGLSLPSMAELHPGTPVEADSVGLVARAAAALRADGARHVVLAVHDGAEATRSLCAAVRGSVDLVLGGHTLECFAGEVAGVPFLQPWAFGSQVGVADVHDDARVELRLVDVGPARPWTGAGAAAQAALEAEVVGHVAAPLRQAAGRERSLGEAIAAGLLRRDDRVDLAAVVPGDLWTQPARDGIGAYLAAGPVSLAQVLRLTPLTGRRSAWGGQLVAAELPPAEAERVIAALGPDVAVARRGRGGTLALSAHSAPAAADWQPIEATWRDSLMEAVSR